MRLIKRHFSLLFISGMVCAMLSATALSAATPAAVDTPWDWSGVIGTGQSLAVGEGGRPILSTNQPYGNLKLSTGHLPWPIDPNDPHLAMRPLVEPVGRYSTNYPSSWPDNIAGETPHSAMANQISALVRAASGREFVGVHSEVGENGQCLIYLKKNPARKGVNGNSYEGALVETKAITRLAKSAGKTYGVGALIVTHGECDAGNANYESDLYQLWSDYNADLRAITGQQQKVLMIVSQQNSINNRSPSTLAQWKIGVDHATDVVCSGPKYQYPSKEGVHLTAEGYQELGEKYGQVYYERVVLGKNWLPLQPISVERKGLEITVRFHVPAPPLVWENAFQSPHESVDAWKAGKGFEVSSANGEKVAIASAAISGDAVVITCATDPGPGAMVGYAMIGEHSRMNAPFPGTFRWGQLRDSDPFTGAVTKKAQPNFAVAFEMPVP
jgi:hypothetical protein